MKLRNGFVSNSSSSSFICDLCGDVESGYDAGLSDMEMFECTNGHTIHDDCGGWDDYTNAKEYENLSEGDGYYESRCGVPTKYCPICNMNTIQDDNVLKFVLTKLKLSKAAVISEMRKKFNHYNHMQNWLSKHKET